MPEPLAIYIDAFGVTEFEHVILGIRSRAEDMAPAFRAVERSFIAVERVQFDSGGFYSGGWQQPALSTLERKAREGGDHRTLHDTLRLRHSLTTLRSPDAVRIITKDFLYMGTRVPYGIYHQSREPRTRLPRRPPVDISEVIAARWLGIIQSYLVHGIVSRR